MAPQKTMVASNNQQTSESHNGSKQAKPRKRKSKQIQEAPEQRQKQQVNNNDAVAGKPAEKNNGQDAFEPSKVCVRRQSSSSSIDNGKKTAHVPSSSPKDNKRPSFTAKAQPVVIGKQFSTDDQDELDTGVELDGSSNSGSSIKDISEDPSKSASISPVMAQGNLVNDRSTKHVAETGPLEQITGALCSSIGSSTTSRKVSTTKQQLAANQHVIDADERLLQEKIQSKKKSLGDISGSINQTSAEKSTKSDQSTRTRRKFSSQLSLEGQDASLCKVCEQHVYQMERLLAEKFVYHKGCFRCHQCKTQLRVDNYSSHEGQVYCKAHHRQLFQPQVRLDDQDDVDIVAKSKASQFAADDYLKHRGRLSEHSFSFLQKFSECNNNINNSSSNTTRPAYRPTRRSISSTISAKSSELTNFSKNTKPTFTSNDLESLKRQMIICENEPAELPKDVVRCDTKVDDGIDHLNLNLNNILDKFERAAASDESQPSSAGIVIEKPSFNVKRALMAFESGTLNKTMTDDEIESSKPAASSNQPVIKRLSNIEGLFNRQNSYSQESEPSQPSSAPVVKRSESLMMRLKKYESRIAGEIVKDDDDDDDGEREVSDNNSTEKGDGSKRSQRPKKLTSINLSSLKSQWENGDIKNKSYDSDEDATTGDKSCNGNSPLAEKNEELISIRQQLASKKEGKSASVRNIYENAIREKEAQLENEKRVASRRGSNLTNGPSTTIIQRQLLQQCQNGSSSIITEQDDAAAAAAAATVDSPNKATITKDHFQLNLSNKANKLKERFELGLVNNSSRDDSDGSDSDDTPQLTKLEQIRQEKLDDLSIFKEGEIKAREARSLFQQIDRNITAASVGGLNRSNTSSNSKQTNGHAKNTRQAQHQRSSLETNQPIRLTNNVKT